MTKKHYLIGFIGIQGGITTILVYENLLTKSNCELALIASEISDVTYETLLKVENVENSDLTKRSEFGVNAVNDEDMIFIMTCEPELLHRRMRAQTTIKIDDKNCENKDVNTKSENAKDCKEIKKQEDYVKNPPLPIKKEKEVQVKVTETINSYQDCLDKLEEIMPKKEKEEAKKITDTALLPENNEKPGKHLTPEQEVALLYLENNPEAMQKIQNSKGVYDKIEKNWREQLELEIKGLENFIGVHESSQTGKKDKDLRANLKEAKNGIAVRKYLLEKGYYHKDDPIPAELYSDINLKGKKNE